MGAIANPFDGCVGQDVLDVYLADGRVLTGSYLSQAGMHFLHVRDGSAMGRVEGPILDSDVASVLRTKSRDEVVQERLDRSRGAPVPGVLRRTRDGYEARLDTLARAAALANRAGDRRRRAQIERQFDEVADEIGLAKTKRRWMLAIAQWALVSNREPSKIDLSGGDLTSAAKFQRPRPQDFDPDPRVRRAAVRPPAEIASDPLSPPNMLKALRAAGFEARRSVIGETDFDKADYLVDFPGGRANGRFAVLGERGEDGAMRWRFLWDGNGSGADRRRQARALSGPDFGVFKNIVARGLDSVPARRDEEAERPVLRR